MSNGAWEKTIYSRRYLKCLPHSRCRTLRRRPTLPSCCLARKHHTWMVNKLNFCECDCEIHIYLLSDMEIDDKIPPLSHIAAKHKIAIKPKRTHGPPRLRRLNTVSTILFEFLFLSVAQAPVTLLAQKFSICKSNLEILFSVKLRAALNPRSSRRSQSCSRLYQR